LADSRKRGYRKRVPGGRKGSNSLLLVGFLGLGEKISDSFYESIKKKGKGRKEKKKESEGRGVPQEINKGRTELGEHGPRNITRIVLSGNSSMDLKRKK